jgi:hypothetical protein
MKVSEVSAAPVPMALTTNSRAEMIITVRRPQTSARRPAAKAPMAQPIRMAPTVTPVPSSVSLKASFRPSWVPLMTPLS